MYEQEIPLSGPSFQIRFTSRLTVVVHELDRRTLVLAYFWLCLIIQSWSNQFKIQQKFYNHFMDIFKQTSLKSIFKT